MEIYKLFYKLPKKRGADASKLVLGDLDPYTAGGLGLIEKPHLYITARLINKINVLAMRILSGEFEVYRCSKPSAYGWYVAETAIADTRQLGRVEKIIKVEEK